MDEISPSNPFHIARAYSAPVPASAPKPVHVDAVGAGAAAPPEHDAGIAGAIGPRRASGIARLVAGVVNGGIDFTTPEPSASRSSLPFYRNPADQNAAATVLARGRHVDVKG